MPIKTVIAQVKGIETKVVNTWFSGAKLLVNQEVVAENNDYFALSKSKPVMTAKVLIDGSEKFVEVFAFAIFTVKIKICVDGIQVAGNSF
jgi:hypothetical protein